MSTHSKVATPASSAARARIGGGAGEEAGHAVGGPVRAFEGEGSRMAHPARQGRLRPRLVAARRIDVGGRARAAVQVLVAAADGEVGLASVQRHRQSAGGMAEVPHGQGAGVVGAGGDGRHVPHPPGAVVDVADGQDGGVLAQRCLEALLGGGAKARPGLLGQGLQHVEVGGELLGVGQDHRPTRAQIEGGGGGLVEVDGGGVAGRSPRRPRRRSEARSSPPHVAAP